MRVKKSNLEWYVFHYNPQYNEITQYNALAGVAEALHKKVIKKEVYDKLSLKEFLLKYFRYNYWSRAEHEILIPGLLNISKQSKIDIYEQLQMNIDRIVDYVNTECRLNF